MELTEFEERAINACRRYRMDDDYAMEDFVEDIRKIMPPTCGVEQRKFLDEVEQLKALTNEEVSFVSFDDFGADLDKVFNGE
jgi:hypothetical protein